MHNVLAGRRGAGGGFTWVIHKFSKQHARLTSPWIDVGGLEWRLKARAGRACPALPSCPELS